MSPRARENQKNYAVTAARPPSILRLEPTQI